MRLDSLCWLGVVTSDAAPVSGDVAVAVAAEFDECGDHGQGGEGDDDDDE